MKEYPSLRSIIGQIPDYPERVSLSEFATGSLGQAICQIRLNGRPVIELEDLDGYYVTATFLVTEEVEEYEKNLKIIMALLDIASRDAFGRITWKILGGLCSDYYYSDSEGKTELRPDTWWDRLVRKAPGYRTEMKRISL